jgi:arabinogalactan oligomer/maltooligosaccharide transport system permease protein
MMRAIPKWRRRPAPVAAPTALLVPPQHRRRRPRWGRIGLKILSHVILILISLFSILPLLWTITTSFKTDAENISSVGLLPHHPVISNYTFVLTNTQFPRWFLNSLIVATLSTALAIVVGTLGGYAMSRWRFYGRGFYGNTLLVVQMFPGVMLAIPLYLLLSRYDLINTLGALVVTYLTFSLALSVWMLKGYFDSIPKEIEEAAFIDGAGRASILGRIVLPLVGPGIATVTIMVFLFAWNEFFFAFIFIASRGKYTLALGMWSFILQFSVQWGYIMAAAVLTTIPVLIVFLLAQRTLSRGLITGAVKQ